MPIDLSDEVLPFTPSDVTVPFVLGPGGALLSPFPGPFPPAHSGVGAINTAGEYRGAYGPRTAPRWLPSYSTYRSTRGAATAQHWGIDLYAPVGTPLLAVVDGDLTFRTQPGGLGLYAVLAFSVQGIHYAFHYGHLSSARGAPRSVVKGETIGFVGCDGNADVDGLCSHALPHGLTSSHVHFALLPPQPTDGVKRSDPVKALGWNVAVPTRPPIFP